MVPYNRQGFYYQVFTLNCRGNARFIAQSQIRVSTYVRLDDERIIRGRGPPVMELLGKNKLELRAYCQSLGEPAYRGAQIYHALYAERKFDVGAMTNLPVALRSKLTENAKITLPTVKHKYSSADGSVRYLFGLPAPEEQTAHASGSGRSRLHAERGPADHLHLHASGLRGGLPVLPDCEIGLDPQSDSGRNPCAGVAAADRDGPSLLTARAPMRLAKNCSRGAHQCRAYGSGGTAPEF